MTVSERERICIFCGEKEVMTGFICSKCQDGIQKEAENRRRDKVEEAARQVKRWKDSEGTSD